MKRGAAPPQAVVVFGASGDLTRRKVIPALYNLARERLLPERYAVVGYARSDAGTDGFRREARESVERFSRTPLDDRVWRAFERSLSYVSGPYDEEGSFRALQEHLEEVDARHGTEGRRLYYCATPPSAFPLVVRRLGEIARGAHARIVVEKPFGVDLASARALNETLHQVFDERDVFRIDHYLGKETVQNLIVFRFANSVFERVWNRDAIDHVQVTVAESDGVGRRGRFYEEAGAVRDILQNHLLQVLCFLAMEPPRSLEPDAVRDEKIKVLRALRPFAPSDAVRGRYEAGDVDGEEVPGYRDEDGVAPDSDTETFVALEARIDNWRWSGVPFFLRTGKRLPRRVTEITVVFRTVPAWLFESEGIECPPADRLTIRIQPDEGITFGVQAKTPGPGLTPHTVSMHFDYEREFDGEPPEAYERLLHDAMMGDQTLFLRQDAVERSWELVAPLLERPGPAHPYAAGTWGPKEAAALVAPRAWELGE